MLIDQYEAIIEQYTKTDDNSWLFRTCFAGDQSVFFNSIYLEMSLDDIYENVEFSLGQVDA